MVRAFELPMRRHFYVRLLRDAKIKPTVEIMKPANMRTYAKACGWALAREPPQPEQAQRQQHRRGRRHSFFRIPIRFEKLSVHGLKPGRGSSRVNSRSGSGSLSRRLGSMISAKCDLRHTSSEATDFTS